MKEQQAEIKLKIGRHCGEEEGTGPAVLFGMNFIRQFLDSKQRKKEEEARERELRNR